MHPDTLAFHAARAPADRRIREAPAHAIERHLPEADDRVWHGHPVWLLDDHAIVGCARPKYCGRRRGRWERPA